MNIRSEDNNILIPVEPGFVVTIRFSKLAIPLWKTAINMVILLSNLEIELKSSYLS